MKQFGQPPEGGPLFLREAHQNRPGREPPHGTGQVRPHWPAPPDRPPSGVPDIDGIDDATRGMLDLVEQWVWFGFHSVHDLQAQIEADTEDDDAIDVPRVLAHARATVAAKRAAESRWPPRTDCDRLEQAFVRMQAEGILTFTYPEAGHCLEHGLSALHERLEADGAPPGRTTGYCFCHAQDLERALDGGGLLLAFGSTASTDDAGFVRIGHQVCDALRREGLEPLWRGSADVRIVLPAFRWQRRMPA